MKSSILPILTLLAATSAACVNGSRDPVGSGKIHCTPVNGAFTGTEGLIAGPHGGLYAAEESGRGIVWKCGDGCAERFATLPDLLGPSAGMLLGLAVVGGNVYVAAPKFQGGSIIRIPLRHPEKTQPFATHLGAIPNGLISNGRVLFVSETISSRLYRLHLHRAEGTRPSADETFRAPRPGPNGLALSPDRHTLYIVHTGLIGAGYLSAVDTTQMKPSAAPVRFAGMGDGLAWWHGSLWACRQHEGQIVRINPNHLERQTAYDLTGGREHGGIRPASIVFYNDRSGRTFGAATDVAEASSLDYALHLFGFPLHWHHGVYRFTTTSIQ